MRESAGGAVVTEEITDESQAPSFSDVKSAAPIAEPLHVLEPRRKLTAEELVARFDRPMKPPAPQPDLRAASDGGMFVAHYAVMDPARSMDTPAPVPSVMFEEHTIPTPETLAEASLTDDQRAFKAQILATSTNFDANPRFDVPGLGTTKTTFGRRHRGSVAWVLLGALLALLLVAAGLLRTKPSASAAAPADARGMRASMAPSSPTVRETREPEAAPATAATPTYNAPSPLSAQEAGLPHVAPFSSARVPVARASTPRAHPAVTPTVPRPTASTSPSPTEPTSDFPPGI